MRSPSRPAVRRLAGAVALATLLGLGVLMPSSAAVADVPVPAPTLSGTVTDDTGAPAAGVSVTLSPAVGAPVTTDAAGHYVVPDLHAGSYTVTFTPPVGSGLLGETYDDKGPGQWDWTQVAVGTTDVTGVDAVLDRAATIAGRVVDEDGHPIPDVTVNLHSVAFVYATARTGADGTYSVGGLRPGSWRVGFTAPNGSPWVSELYDDARTEDAQTVVPLVAGAAVTLNDAVLARGGTITGRILGPDGTPRAGIEVYASTESGGSGATTAADGTYALSGLADGDYTVYAQPDWAGNLVAVVYPGTTHWQDAEDVHVTAGTTVALGDMTMPLGATISGHVLDADGKPVAGATVKAVSDEDQNGATTGSDGSYTIRLLSPETYRVAASGWAPVSIVRTFYAATPGVTRASQATPLVLAAGDSASGIDIHAGARGTAVATLVATAAHAPVLGEPFTVDVTVTGPQGVPTGSVWVGVTLVRDVVYADAELDASGHATLTFDAVDQGDYPVVEVGYDGDATYGTAAADVDYLPVAAPVPAPSITALAPSSGTVLGGSPVTVSGTGFGPDSTVTFGGVPATTVVDGPTSLVATAPAHAAGPADVVVTSAGRASAPATFTYEKVATSLTLTGPTGSTTAGAAATFTATVGATPAPTGSVTFVVDGAAPVAVALAGGKATLSTSTLAAGSHTVVATFAGDDTYRASTGQVTHTVTAPPAGALPTVTCALPNVGLSTGGTLTVLTGKNFVKGKTTVGFGSTATTKVTVLSSTLLTVVVPPHAVGAVRVTVTTPAGRSATSVPFVYVAPPTWHLARFGIRAPALGGDPLHR